MAVNLLEKKMGHSISTKPLVDLVSIKTKGYWPRWVSGSIAGFCMRAHLHEVLVTSRHSLC